MRPNCDKKLSLKKLFVVFGVVVLGLWGMESYASGTSGNKNHSKMNHEKMNNGKMNNGKMNNGKMNHEKMNRGKMNRGKMNRGKMNNNGRKTLIEAVKKSVVSVLEANEKLHNSFFKYDGKSVEKNALNLKKAIDGIKDKEIAKLLNFSKTKLNEIKVSNDRETNNKNYHLVSMALIHVVNKYDVGTKYNAYSCPMVKKKWLQNSRKMSKVHNPYAPNMPHCGSQDSHH